MDRSALTNSHLSLAPLGAGDLIDRTVRFYRKNFWTFVLIAAPPVIVGTIFLLGWTMLGRNLFAVNSGEPFEMAVYQIFISFGAILIWIIQTIATMVVMGGASRNFVRHLLFNEAITFRETYKSVKERIGGLIVVSTLIATILGIFALVLLNIAVIIIAFGVMLIAAVFAFSNVLAVGVSIIFGAAALFGTLWLFFLVTSRFVYVPQIMLVEGRTAMSAIGRSTFLASKNVKRVAALFIFTLVATYSALAILYVPVGWYAWVNGVDFFAFDSADSMPAWYEISNQVISQVSLILLTPIWMIGLCLLYVDERVRNEGYDIELMAARRLGEIPSVPATYVNPLHPALSDQTGAGGNKEPERKKNASISPLGLN